jgi:predicted enzyme related to lactoylglutathione lyase
MSSLFWIWNENKWGKSNFGAIILVFRCDSLEETYNRLKQNGVNLDQPSTASWGGRELICKDFEGNIILMLE